MEQLISDSLLIITAVSGVIIIAVTILIFVLSRKSKNLSYNLVSITPLLTVEEEEKGKLKITYEDKPVTNAYILVLKVINSGNVPILKSDYENQVEFIFKDKVKILSSKIIEKNPENIKVDIIEGSSCSVSIQMDTVSGSSTSHSSSTSYIAMPPVLLNSGDYIKYKIILEIVDDKPFENEKNFENKITVDGRIIGVKSIQPLKERDVSDLMFKIGIISGIFGLLLFKYINEIVGVILLFIGYILVVFAGVWLSITFIKRLTQKLKKYF